MPGEAVAPAVVVVWAPAGGLDDVVAIDVASTAGNDGSAPAAFDLAAIDKEVLSNHSVNIGPSGSFSGDALPGE